eukprot:TRINITY_DN9259_c0_g1_i1.p2 TRINITY_DN9259_c0_g1~~TRINITY_DN9259_c0_g1_i1.p2  ORF type:complete len:229 (-),score=41.83 TRINITY_DN9259_c0_g1_i1:321-1007(-)
MLSSAEEANAYTVQAVCSMCTHWPEQTEALSRAGIAAALAPLIQGQDTELQDCCCQLVSLLCSHDSGKQLSLHPELIGAVAGLAEDSEQVGTLLRRNALLALAEMASCQECHAGLMEAGVLTLCVEILGSARAQDGSSILVVEATKLLARFANSRQGIEELVSEAGDISLSLRNLAEQQLELELLSSDEVLVLIEALGAVTDPAVQQNLEKVRQVLSELDVDVSSIRL